MTFQLWETHMIDGHTNIHILSSHDDIAMCFSCLGGVWVSQHRNRNSFMFALNSMSWTSWLFFTSWTSQSTLAVVFLFPAWNCSQDKKSLREWEELAVTSYLKSNTAHVIILKLKIPTAFHVVLQPSSLIIHQCAIAYPGLCHSYFS